MPRRYRDLPAPDVFETFAHRVDEPEQSEPVDRRRLARSVGLGAGGVVLAMVAFVGGFWWGAEHEPDLAYVNLAWEGAIRLSYAALCGALAAAVVLAVAAAAVGVPWARAQRDRERGVTRESGVTRQRGTNREHGVPRERQRS